MAQNSAYASTLSKVHDLSDLELATLSCLIAEQHCIIQSESSAIDGLEEELRLVAKKIFALPIAVINFSPNSSLDDFGSAILVERANSKSKTNGHKTPLPVISSVRSSSRRDVKASNVLSSIDSKQIANVVVARNLHTATSQLQTQVLELIRGKRIFTRTAIHVAPKRFLFIALLPLTLEGRLNSLVTDHFFISHIHATEDELPNIDSQLVHADAAEDSLRCQSEAQSIASPDAIDGVLSKADIDQLILLSSAVRMTAEVRAYIHNVVVFMRMHRAVAGGVSSLATRHFHLLVRALAPLHGLDYVPPSLVALAARKVYPHRIILTTPEKERSMQWGSSVEAVKDELEGVTAEDVIEDVLRNVEVPL